MNTQDDKPAKAPIPLDLPTVPLALEGGLIPIEYLTAPITVNFPVWPAAETGYTYQLVFDGVRVPPEKAIVVSDQPGDVLEVAIPQALFTEGTHDVSYRIHSPNTLDEVYSDSITIVIDKTAPGAPDLAPLLFPADVQGGLTSDELASLGDVLVGRIAGYSGMAAGDEIRTYWGALEGPLAVVDANDMGLNSVSVEFTRGFLEQAEGLDSNVYYTVTDVAGNVSMRSEGVEVSLQLSVLAPLPLPTVKEAQGGTLDPAAAVNGATVLIDVTAKLREGDEVNVRWDGPKGSDARQQSITAELAGSEVSLVFTNALVAVNDGQTVEIVYSVNRRNGAIQTSEKLELKILSAALDLPAPTVDTVGPDGVLRLSLISGPNAVVRASYRGMDPADTATVQWAGASLFESPPQTVGQSTHLKFEVPTSIISESEGGTAAVTYTVTRNGVEMASQALQLTVREGLMLDTSPVALTGKVYLIPGRPDVLPTFPTGTTLQRAASGGTAPYTYATSDPEIVQVDAEGLASVRGNGLATVSVTDAAGESKHYSVSVTGVIACQGLGSGNLTQMSNKASAQGARIPSIHELIEIFNAYGGRWPMGNGNYWSSTVAKDLFGAKWYYVKNLNTGQDFKLLHTNSSLGVAIR